MKYEDGDEDEDEDGNSMIPGYHRYHHLVVIEPQK